MTRTRLDELDAYDLVGEPVIADGRLMYRHRVDVAVEPYNATRLPQCTVHGLWDALRRAEELDHPPIVDEPALGVGAPMDIDEIRIIQL